MPRVFVYKSSVFEMVIEVCVSRKSSGMNWRTVWLLEVHLHSASENKLSKGDYSLFNRIETRKTIVNELFKLEDIKFVSNQGIAFHADFGYECRWRSAKGHSRHPVILEGISRIVSPHKSVNIAVSSR